MKTVSLVGYRFNNLEQEEVEEMFENPEFKITIEPEPDNVYDQEAIALYCQKDSETKMKVGFIAKNHTKFIKEYINKPLKFTISTLFPASI